MKTRITITNRSEKFPFNIIFKPGSDLILSLKPQEKFEVSHLDSEIDWAHMYEQERRFRIFVDRYQEEELKDEYPCKCGGTLKKKHFAHKKSYWYECSSCKLGQSRGPKVFDSERVKRKKEMLGLNKTCENCAFFKQSHHNKILNNGFCMNPLRDSDIESKMEITHSCESFRDIPNKSDYSGKRTCETCAFVRITEKTKQAHLGTCHHPFPKKTNFSKYSPNHHIPEEERAGYSMGLGDWENGCPVYMPKKPFQV